MAAILEVPVLYTAHYVPRGHRNPVSSLFTTRIAVRVDEIAGERAPVVASATLSGGRRVDYRRLGDGLLRPLRVSLPDGYVALTRENAQASLDAFLASLDRGPNHSKIRWPFLPEDVHTHRQPMTEPGDYRMITRSDKDERIAAFRDLWQHGAAFVDGALHVRSAGPAWKVVNDGKLPDSKPHLRPIEDAAWLPGKAFETDAAFPPDRLRLAEIRTYERADLGDLETRREYNRAIGPTVGAIEVVPTLGEREMLALDLAAAARSQLRIAAFHLASMRPEVIHAYADLKRVQIGGVDGETIDAMAAALRDFREICGTPSSRVTGYDDPIVRLLRDLYPDPEAAPSAEGPRP